MIGRNLPNNPVERIDWLSAYAPVWVEHAAAIGIGAGMA